MNSVQLKCFLEVAKELNFARAAENLHFSQPTATTLGFRIAANYIYKSSPFFIRILF